MRIPVPTDGAVLGNFDVIALGACDAQVDTTESTSTIAFSTRSDAAPTVAPELQRTANQQWYAGTYVWVATLLLEAARAQAKPTVEGVALPLLASPTMVCRARAARGGA